MKSKEEIMKEKAAEKIIKQSQSNNTATEKKQTTVYLHQRTYEIFKQNLSKNLTPSQIFNAVMVLYNEDNKALKKLLAEQLIKSFTI